VSEPLPFPNVCVIGSGPRGIAACRALSESGIRFDCFEKRDSVAGGLFERTEVEGATTSPQACVIAEELEAYVDRFGLRDRIAFGCAVEYVLPLPDGSWRVHLARGPASRYDALFVAAGSRRAASARNRADLLAPESLPFIDPEEREVLRDDFPLWNHLVHPRYQNLYFLARLPTVRHTLCIAEEQSKLAAGSIAQSYALPTRQQMHRERRAVLRGNGGAHPDFHACPASVSDTRYAFHLRWERARRTHGHATPAGRMRAARTTSERRSAVSGAQR